MSLNDFRRSLLIKMVSITMASTVFLSQVPLSYAADDLKKEGEPAQAVDRRVYAKYDSYDSSLKVVAKSGLWGGAIGFLAAVGINLVADREAVNSGPVVGAGILLGIGWGIYEYRDKRERDLVSNEDQYRPLEYDKASSVPERLFKVNLVSYKF